MYIPAAATTIRCHRLENRQEDVTFTNAKGANRINSTGQMRPHVSLQNIESREDRQNELITVAAAGREAGKGGAGEGVRRGTTSLAEG